MAQPNPTPLLPLFDVVYEGKWFTCLRTKQPLDGLTEVHEIVLTKTGMVAAHLGWYAPWRKYVMLPREETIWDQSCLAEIATILAKLMQERRRR